MKSKLTQEVPSPIAWMAIFLSVLAFFTAYSWNISEKRVNELKMAIIQANDDRDKSEIELNGRINSLEKRQDSMLAIIRANEAVNGKFSEKIVQIDQTVGDLQKLTSTDPELLKKYSKIYFLNEHYAPASLSGINPEYVYGNSSTLQIHTSVLPHLERMLNDAKSVGANLKILSAFRSFGSQAVLKSNYKLTYGYGTANSFSAEQGYSEHQLGTTVDFTNDKIGNTFKGFDASKEYKWLIDNSYKYGFVISYPKENKYYMYEPWHFRFVGIKLATLVHDMSTYFYALDQRVIDSYLGNIFDAN